MVAGPDEERAAPARVLRPEDERSLADFYARWSPFVYSLALRSLHDVAEAEDVTQQVFTAAWTSGCPWGAGEDTIPVQLLEIAHERIGQAVAARRRPARLELRSSTPAPVGPDGPTELADQVSALDGISRLDPLPRQALQMALQDDLTHVEIAERTGRGVDDVRRHLRQALESLRARLEVQTDAR